jgi:hypothetical protein
MYSQNQLSKCKKAIKNNLISNIISLWDNKLIEVHINYLRDEFRKDGLSIYEVNTKSIIHNLALIEKLFLDEGFYVRDLIPEKLTEIVLEWKDLKCLTPPAIIVCDEIFDKENFDISKIYVHDGKHRLKVAYYFNNITIPIIVCNYQIPYLKNIFIDKFDFIKEL